MDDFLDPFLSSSSWSDIDETERPSWVGPTGSRENGLPAAIVKACKGDEKEPPICMIPSSCGMGKLVTHKANVHVQDVAPSIFVGENLKYGVGLFTGENQQQQEVTDRISITPEHENHSRERSSLFQGIDDRNLTSGSFAPEFNTSSFSHSAVTESGSFESNDSQPSVFPQSLGGSLSISALWSPSYSGVSTVGMGQGKVHGFGLQGEFLETDADVLGKRGLDNEKLSLLDSFPTALDGLSEPHNSSHLPSFTAGSQLNLMNTTSFQSHQQVLQGQSDLTNPHLSFVTGQKRTLNGTSGLQTHQQLLQTGEGNSINHYANHSPAAQSQSAQANGGSCNGAVKPRVRARRGQATDPHSIAERLRREKIAERMKNLQELVPNSNKTDKASMLDEIIDYVKFLQLQVKVLSMSRLGAAGAIVPLITDAQHEGSNSLLLSSSPAGQGVADLTESMDNLAFEQEVVKLMESNITTAMQYLQNKGLCLMPIALATAISGRKGSSCAIPPERKKSDAISQNTKSMTEGWNERKDGTNGSNGAAVKQEEAPKP